MSTNSSVLEKLQKVISNFPLSFQNAFSAIPHPIKEKINEIRIRAGLPVSITLDGENYLLSQDGSLKTGDCTSVSLKESEIERFVYQLCAGSVYSYSETIKEGYITKDGIRVGLGGVVLVRSDNIEGISKITSLNIRVPRHIPGAACHIIKQIESQGLSGGIIAVSPPGQGKTTFLRDLGINLSRGICCQGKDIRFRTAIIDERSELFIEELFKDCIIDVLNGCPKAKGIEIATRVLSPEIIICDEIGSEREADEILKTYTQGVILIASCHGSDYEDVLQRPHIRRLIDNGVFDYAYCMKRIGEQIIGETVKCRT